MKPRNKMQSILLEALDGRMSGVGTDFPGKGDSDERGYVPSPRIDPFHLNDEKYISRQTRNYEQKRERKTKPSHR